MRISKRSNVWTLYLGEFPKNFVVINYGSWRDAMDGAERCAGKEILKAANDEFFLMHANVALNKMIQERVTK